MEWHAGSVQIVKAMPSNDAISLLLTVYLPRAFRMRGKGKRSDEANG